MLELTDDLTVVEGKVNRMPTLRNRLFQMARTFQFKGAKASLTHYAGRVFPFLRKADEKQHIPEESLVDQRFAADSFESPLRELAIQSPNAKWGLPYAPTRPAFFEQVVGSLPVRLNDYDFIDLGAGKGLALFLASKYPFKSITGVEYSKVLVNQATENISSYQELGGGHGAPKCIWGDAVNFELPQTPTVLYLFNPFQGKVMDRVIANLEESLRVAPRDLWVIYEIPWEGRKFRRSPMLKTIEWNSDYSLHRSASR
jgi:hypothetical protein